MQWDPRFGLSLLGHIRDFARLIGLALALLFLLHTPRPALATPTEGPGLFVERIIGEAIAQATGEMPIDTRRAVIRDLLQRYIDLPNFERVTLGRLGRSATEDERKQYFVQFEELIVRVFAVGAAHYGGETLNVVHVHPASGEEVVVSSEVVRPSSQKFAVDWVLVIKDSSYQVRDIIFENISARLLLRDAMANLADRHGGKLSDVLPILAGLGRSDDALRQVNPLNPFGSLAHDLQGEDNSAPANVPPAKTTANPAATAALSAPAPTSSASPIAAVAATLPDQAPTNSATPGDNKLNRAPFEPTGAGARFIDLFGYLSILVRGADLTARALTVGGFVFMLLMHLLGISQGEDRTRRIFAISAISLVIVGSVGIALEVAALLLSTDLDGGRVAGADFIIAGMFRIGGALLLLALLRMRAQSASVNIIFGSLACLVVMTGSILASHSFAQIDYRAVLMSATFAHELGASAWIGGIPYFLAALASAERVNDRQAVAAIGRNFSLLSMISVAILLLAGTVLTVGFTQSLEGFYATAYGTMVASKIAVTLGILSLGAANFTVTEQLRRDPATSILRMRRFAEAEIGVGITVFFIAASLTSLPPAKDLENQRPTFAEIVERLTPRMPSLETPLHADLSIPQLQAKLDAQSKESAESKVPRAYIPGWVDPPPSNAADVLWSEYNHHWAGIFVLLIGLVATLELFGVTAARNWPLIFLGLAVFLFIRSDPSAWPMGDIGFWESMLEPEAFQHRTFVVLIVAFGIFEWMVRTGRMQDARAALVFPLGTAVGGALLLSHSHSLGNFKEELLIEITHLPLGLAGILAAWARWLELRLPGTKAGRIAGWVWRISFIFIGFMLLSYRET